MLALRAFFYMFKKIFTPTTQCLIFRQSYDFETTANRPDHDILLLYPKR